MGTGIWHPAGPTLRKIRGAIDEDAQSWEEASKDRSFRKVYELAGDSLVRAPQGYSVDHPLIEDLRRKDFIGVTQLDDQAILADDLLENFTRLCHVAAPFQRWLCGAVGVPY